MLHDPTVNPRLFTSHDQKTYPDASAALLGRTIVEPPFVNDIWHVAPALVIQVDCIAEGAGEPSKFGAWLLTKLPYGLMSGAVSVEFSEVLLDWLLSVLDEAVLLLGRSFLVKVVAVPSRAVLTLLWFTFEYTKKAASKPKITINTINKSFLICFGWFLFFIAKRFEYTSNYNIYTEIGCNRANVFD